MNLKKLLYNGVILEDNHHVKGIYHDGFMINDKGFRLRDLRILNNELQYVWDNLRQQVIIKALSPEGEIIFDRSEN